MCLSAWIVDSGQWTGAFGTQINFYLSAARAALQRDEVVQCVTSLPFCATDKITHEKTITI